VNSVKGKSTCLSRVSGIVYYRMTNKNDAMCLVNVDLRCVQQNQASLLLDMFSTIDIVHAHCAYLGQSRLVVELA